MNTLEKYYDTIKDIDAVLKEDFNDMDTNKLLKELRTEIIKKALGFKKSSWGSSYQIDMDYLSRFITKDYKKVIREKLDSVLEEHLFKFNKTMDKQINEKITAYISRYTDDYIAEQVYNDLNNLLERRISKATEDLDRKIKEIVEVASNKVFQQITELEKVL